VCGLRWRKVNKFTETWALVTDGGRARVVALKRHPAEFREVRKFQSPTRQQPSRSLEDDASGRSHHVRGPGSHTHEPRVSGRDQEEQRFTAKVLELLSQAAQAGEFQSLLLAADPRSLGNIRTQMDEALRKAVVKELNLDLTRLDTKKLESRLREALGWPTR